MEKVNYLYKVIILGDQGTGKTSFLNRFTRNEFQYETKSTTGVEFAIKSATIGTDEIRVQIWDTAGQERFRAMTPNYYRGAHAVIIIYDITDRASYENIPRWFQDMAQFLDPDSIVVLMGNKCDCEGKRQVSAAEGEEFAMKKELFWLETSAKDAFNVVECFQHVFQKIHSTFGTTTPRLHSVSLSDAPVALSPPGTPIFASSSPPPSPQRRGKKGFWGRCWA